MNDPVQIPTFALFGETAPFPDVVHCETISARAPVHGWKIHAHRHVNMAQLFAITSGSVEANIDGREINLSSGSFLFVAAHSVHNFTFEPRTQGNVVTFPLSILKSIGPTSDDINRVLSRSFHAASDQMLTVLIDALAKIFIGPHPYRRQSAVGLAHCVLSHVAGLQSLQSGLDASPAQERLAQLDGLIAQHQAQGWGASDYAAALALTTGHLSRLCRSAAGIGATAYIERSVMDEACRLLAFTRLSVAEVGYRLGYADPSYFSKRFRVVQQQSPSDYRQQFVS